MLFPAMVRLFIMAAQSSALGGSRDVSDGGAVGVPFGEPVRATGVSMEGSWACTPWSPSSLPRTTKTVTPTAMTRNKEVKRIHFL